jgi:hypothetical protein
MSNNKQSSVEWLAEQIKNDINLRLRGFDIDKALEQAKAMHEEEIINAHFEGQCDETEGCPLEIAKKFYNETFNTKEK